MNRVVEFIEAHTALFKREIGIIGETTYVLKGPLSLFPSATTTWGERNVSLVKGFYLLPLAIQAAILIHETVHERQYEMYGKWGFWTNYLREHFTNGYAKNSFEEEARDRENQFRVIVGLPRV